MEQDNLLNEKTLQKKQPAPHASPFYKTLVPAYQAIWPPLAKKRMLRAVESLQIPAGAKVLEVGVGTGMSLESYPHNIDLTGVDLSEEMLAEADLLKHSKNWNHVTLKAMNAEKLEFEDSSFDVVTSFHTISVVSNPQAMMSEVVRVCRPGGKILMINHFRSENPLVAMVVDSVGHITKRLGWRTDLELAEVLRAQPLLLNACYKPNPMSLFTVMEATRVVEEIGGGYVPAFA